MNKNSKTKQQLLLEIEELRTRLEATERRLQEANEILQAQIAERKRVEQTFEKVQEYTESIVETIREPLLVLASDLRVLSANRSFYDTFKVTLKETTGNLIYNLGNRQWDIPRLRTLLEDILTKNSKFDNYEVEHVFSNIGHKIMLLNARRIVQKEIGSQMILLAIEDITERRHLKSLLEAHEAKYRELVQNANSIILKMDPEGKVTFFNEFAQMFFGYNEEEMLGRSVVGSIIPETGSSGLGPNFMIKDIGINPEKFITNENENMRRNGERVWVAWTNKAIRDGNGKVIEILCIGNDITERRRLEMLLSESEERYRRLFETANDGILLLEKSEGNITHANPALTAMLGYSKEECIGNKLQDIGFSHDMGDFREIMHTLDRSGIIYYDDVLIKNRAGQTVYVDIYMVDRARLVQCNIRDITERKHAEEALKNAFDEVKKLKEQFEAENIYLREEVELKDGFKDIIGTSSTIKYAMHKIQQVAPTSTTVLLTGETGTGKGLFARSLHQSSGRRDKAFVKVNCAGLPPNLIESELFGREKGAFTGSTARQIGRFELANGGTIFLDEIGELPLELQSKLLKVIEDGEFERLGSPHAVKVDVRIIASTNRDLEEEIKKGQFRKDLFYRLNVFPVTIPSLRQRREDIPLLVKFYADRFSKSHGKNIEKIPKNAMKALEDYAWPGNVRELMNVIERAVIVSDGPELRLAEKVDALPIDSIQENEGMGARETKGLVEVEREHILRTLQDTGWRIEGLKGAAQLLGMNPSTLKGRMKKLGIKRPRSE